MKNKGIEIEVPNLSKLIQLLEQADKQAKQLQKYLDEIKEFELVIKS
ncbi:hypothetical protein [Lentilactobacillus sp. SPB1-3]|uniref:Uncharacterized protein n=1 Tax=Lentilactobacillus terminaliae TaxID=3003483 RepID=A0ACD5DDB9_9LACO|nr:hypothetical protein [Lentilactobacillus sp. SPB1-3]MCZ0978138.1 hypothetical protein [Lentilactobacillus sp. SPB1-3]